MQPNDPTWSGSPVPAGGKPAILSRNEIEALSFKASRGAGMSWGMAEEAGRAVAWLAQHGIESAAMLLAHLQNTAGKSWVDICPDLAPGRWLARPGQTLCPFAFGAVFCDHVPLADGPLASGQLEVGPVAYPALSLSFLATASKRLDQVVSARWEGGMVCVASDGSIAGDLEAFCALEKAMLFLANDEVGSKTPACGIGKVAAKTLAGLNAFALETTVPPSERSRAGAGSNDGDND